MLPVEFENSAGGLWLSYDSYRNLEKNIRALRDYTEQLLIIIDFYQGETDG